MVDIFEYVEILIVWYLAISAMFLYNVLRIGHSKATGEKDVMYLTEHKDRIIHFHIHDGSEKPPKNHLALGDGEINLVSRLELAKNRNARCVLETKTIEALKKSVEWLKENSTV